MAVSAELQPRELHEVEGCGHGARSPGGPASGPERHTLRHPVLSVTRGEAALIWIKPERKRLLDLTRGRERSALDLAQGYELPMRPG